jgi:hypothetical protein
MTPMQFEGHAFLRGWFSFFETNLVIFIDFSQCVLAVFSRCEKLVAQLAEMFFSAQYVRCTFTG